MPISLDEGVLGDPRHLIDVIGIRGAALMRISVGSGIVRASAEVHAITLAGISDDGALDEAADIESRSRDWRHHQRRGSKQNRRR